MLFPSFHSGHAVFDEKYVLPLARRCAPTHGRCLTHRPDFPAALGVPYFTPEM